MNALRTLRSLRRHGGAPFWTLDVHGDYRLRDFLRAGARNEREILLGRFDMHHAIGSAFHFHLADASGASAVVEWGPDGAARTIRPAPGAPQACTNFRLDLRPAEPSSRLGTDRYDLMEKTLAAAGGRIPSEAAAMDLLSAVAHPRDDWDPSNLVAGTQWSAVFDLAAPSALLCANCDYTRRWRIPVTRRFADCPSRGSAVESCAVAPPAADRPSRIRRFVKIGKIESCHFVRNCKTESRHSVSFCLTEGENRGRFVRV